MVLAPTVDLVRALVEALPDLVPEVVRVVQLQPALSLEVGNALPAPVVRGTEILRMEVVTTIAIVAEKGVVGSRAVLDPLQLLIAIAVRAQRIILFLAMDFVIHTRKRTEPMPPDATRPMFALNARLAVRDTVVQAHPGFPVTAIQILYQRAMFATKTALLLMTQKAVLPVALFKIICAKNATKR